MGKVTEHPVIAVTTLVPNLKIPFALVRGGDLTVSVEAVVGARTLRGEKSGMSIVGINPLMASLVTATTGAPLIFRKLMQLESRLRQFRAPNCPLFPKTDEHNLLVVHLDEGGRTGTAEWERIAAADRDAAGDPNYVDDVLSQTGF